MRQGAADDPVSGDPLDPGLELAEAPAWNSLENLQGLAVAGA